MPDRIRAIVNSIIEWWKHFTRKQQMIIASSVLVVAIAIAILAFVLTRPEMVVIKTCEDAKEAATVQGILDDNGIYNEVSDNGLVFTIKKKDSSTANILLGSNAIATDDERLKDILSGSLSTTEADKTKLYIEHMENRMENDIAEVLDNVESATVTLHVPEDDGTLIAQQQESYAEVFLTLNGEMDEEQALGLAKMVATGLGNKTTDNISIMDSNMNLLYAGGVDGTTSVSGALSSQLSQQQKKENKVKNEVKKVLLGTGQYQSAEVGVNLPLSFSETKTTSKTYSVAEGRDEGYLLENSEYTSETTDEAGNIPGTDTNGEDGANYVLNDGDNTSQSVTDTTNKYGVDQTITETTDGPGSVLSDEATISIALRKARKYDEDQLRRDGALDDMTFEEYRAQIESQDPVQLQVGDDIIALAANAAGVDPERVSIVAYEEPVFVPTSGSGRTLADYLEIILAVLIFALLAFVVFMSTRRDRQAEMEPELSVESLLQTTKENSEEENLEDIGFKEKSEARILIEKFVDEKPEAVASLLRNWLNEDWE